MLLWNWDDSQGQRWGGVTIGCRRPPHGQTIEGGHVACNYIKIEEI
jgi:hypothetical protein